MTRIAQVLIVGIGLGSVGFLFARAAEDGERVKEVARYDIKEKVDEKEAAVTMVEVTIGPGQAGLPHRHPGPAFVYVIEGEYELGIDDQPTKRFKAGESFQEPAGCVHRVSRNPAASGNTRLVAVILHPRDAKEIAAPEKPH